MLLKHQCLMDTYLVPAIQSRLSCFRQPLPVLFQHPQWICAFHDHAFTKWTVRERASPKARKAMQMHARQEGWPEAMNAMCLGFYEQSQNGIASLDMKDTLFYFTATSS